MATEVFPYAYGAPPVTGVIKAEPEDFIVEEMLGFTPLGQGEHAFLRVQKRGENTDYLARQLAKFAAVPRQSVSYAGLKDRHGVTIQWFSVHLPGKSGPNWAELNSDSITVLEATRNDRKLKKGALKSNRFHLIVRDLQGNPDSLSVRLKAIATSGTPNYFGTQRFGHNGDNVAKAAAMFRGEMWPNDRHLRGIYLSAARSWLFNQVLGRRVETGTWNHAIQGDVFMFSDSHSFFTADLDASTLDRIDKLNIHPSGPLWGKGISPAADASRAIETEVVSRWTELSSGLEAADVEMARRPLRLVANNLNWSFGDGILNVSFELASGSYATTFLREAIDFEGEED